MSDKIMLVIAKCEHCEKDIVGPKDEFDKIWNNHLDTCTKFIAFMEVLKDLHEKNLLQPTIQIFRMRNIKKSLKRIIKKYKTSSDELIEILTELG